MLNHTSGYPRFAKQMVDQIEYSAVTRRKYVNWDTGQEDQDSESE